MPCHDTFKKQNQYDFPPVPAPPPPAPSPRPLPPPHSPRQLPENGALDGMSDGMIAAWDKYGSQRFVTRCSCPANVWHHRGAHFYPPACSAVILFIVEEVTYNICDQRFMEFSIRERRPEIRVLRRTLAEVDAQGRMDDGKRLFLGEDEVRSGLPLEFNASDIGWVRQVAVIYFRCGYSPDQYPGEGEWRARLLMERSRAVKSPSIHYHLAGTKKVQQELAKEGTLERFLGDPGEVKAVRDVFTGLYPVGKVRWDTHTHTHTITKFTLAVLVGLLFPFFFLFFFFYKTEDGNRAFEMALSHPDRYVLKPQREGGGNNVYGEDIAPFLRKIRDSEERDAYILMDRINPPTTKNYVVSIVGGGGEEKAPCAQPTTHT